MRTSVQPLGAPPAVGAYSPGVLADGWLFTSGQVGVDPGTGTPHSTVEEQVEGALSNLRDLLAAAGGTLDDVVSVTCLLSDMGSFDAFNKIYARWFGPTFPARATYGVRLGDGFLVELQAVAYIGNV